MRASGERAADTRTSITIEGLLHWVYRDCSGMAQAAREDRLDGNSNIDTLRRFIGFAELGTLVDGSGTALSMDADAEAVHTLVRRLPPRDAGLVIWHSFVGDRPDWLPGARTRFAPVMVERGGREVAQVIRTPAKLRKFLPHAVTVQAFPRRRHRNAKPWTPTDALPTHKHDARPLLCPVRLVDPPDATAKARAGYAVWWQACARLSAELKGGGVRLSRWMVTGFRAPAVPWAEENQHKHKN